MEKDLVLSGVRIEGDRPAELFYVISTSKNSLLVSLEALQEIVAIEPLTETLLSLSAITLGAAPADVTAGKN